MINKQRLLQDFIEILNETPEVNKIALIDELRQVNMRVMFLSKLKKVKRELLESSLPPDYANPQSAVNYLNYILSLKMQKTLFEFLLDAGDLLSKQMSNDEEQ